MSSAAENGSQQTAFQEAMRTAAELGDRVRPDIFFALSYIGTEAYLIGVEQHPVLASLVHPFTNPFNAGMFSTDFAAHGMVGVAAGTAESAVTVLALTASATLAAKLYERERQFAEGDGVVGDGFLRLNRLRFSDDVRWLQTVGIRSPIIFAQNEGAMPLFGDVLEQLTDTKQGSPKNIVLFKAGSNASLDENEKSINKWVSSRGPEPFIETARWRRTGAFDSPVIVLNSSNLFQAREAVRVIRSQLRNSEAQILVIASGAQDVPKQLPSEDGVLVQDTEKSYAVVSPYISVVHDMLASLRPEHVATLVPDLTDNTQDIGYLEELKTKRFVLEQKLQLLPTDRPVRVFLNGDAQDEEGIGFSNALSLYAEQCEVVSEPNAADIILTFGNGDITGDLSALEVAEAYSDSQGNANQIHLGVVFRRGNIDNMLDHADGVLCFEASMSAVISNQIQEYVEHKVTLWQRLTKLLHRAS